MSKAASEATASFKTAAHGYPSLPFPDHPTPQFLNDLDTWHTEREGFSPDETSTTPVWIKCSDGTWAHAATTWHNIIADLEVNLAELRHELHKLKIRQHRPLLRKPDKRLEHRVLH